MGLLFGQSPFTTFYESKNGNDNRFVLSGPIDGCMLIYDAALGKFVNNNYILFDVATYTFSVHQILADSITSTLFTGDLTGTASKADTILTTLSGLPPGQQFFLTFGQNQSTVHQSLFVDSNTSGNPLTYNPGSRILICDNYQIGLLANFSLFSSTRLLLSGSASFTGINLNGGLTIGNIYANNAIIGCAIKCNSTTATDAFQILDTAAATIFAINEIRINSNLPFTDTAGFIGPLTGNASLINTTLQTTGTRFLTLVPLSATSPSGQAVGTHATLSYNVATATLATTNMTATTFTGSLTGSATLIDTSLAASATTYFIPMVEIGATAQPNGQTLRTDTEISFNSNTLTCTNIDVVVALRIYDSVISTDYFRLGIINGELAFNNDWSPTPTPLRVDGNGDGCLVYKLNVVDTTTSQYYTFQSANALFQLLNAGNQVLAIQQTSSYFSSVSNLLVIGDGDGSTTPGVVSDTGLILTGPATTQVGIINDSGTLLIRNDFDTGIGGFSDVLRISKNGFQIAFTRNPAIDIDPPIVSYNNATTIYAPLQSNIYDYVSIQANNSAGYVLEYSVINNKFGRKPIQIGFNYGLAGNTSGGAGAKSIYVSAATFTMTKNGGAFTDFAVGGMVLGVANAITGTQVGGGSYTIEAPYTQLTLTTTPDTPLSSATDVYQLILVVSTVASGLTAIGSTTFSRFNGSTSQVQSGGGGGSFTFTSPTPSTGNMYFGNTFPLYQLYASIPDINQVYISPNFSAQSTETYDYVFNPEQFQNYEITWNLTSNPTTAFATLSIDITNPGAAPVSSWNGSLTTLGSGYANTGYASQATCPIVQTMNQNGAMYRCNLYFNTTNRVSLAATNNGSLSAGVGTANIPFIATATHNSTTLYTSFVWSLSAGTMSGYVSIRGYN